MRPSINIHIEELILDGYTFTPAEQAQLREALSTELARLLAVGGVSPQLTGAAESVAAPPITPAAPAQAAQLGRQIARAIYGDSLS